LEENELISLIMLKKNATYVAVNRESVLASSPLGNS